MLRRKDTSLILKRRSSRKKRVYFARVFRWFACASVLVVILGMLTATGVYFYFSMGLPKIYTLSDYRPPVITTLLSDDGRKIAEFYRERRIVIPLSSMPKMLIDAFIAAEDARFFEHEGIDFLSVVRAFLRNIEAGAIVQGGSTITQQVARSFFLSRERSYSRKVKEAILAYRIDRALTKEEILFLYLNQIYLGHRAYGVEAAAQNYFGKYAKELNLAESAMLAGLPQAPSRNSPFRNPEIAKRRQMYVLTRMVAEGYITNAQAEGAAAMALDIKPRRNLFIEKVPFFTEHIRRYIVEKYGEGVLRKDGLTIHTTVNIEMQRAAQAAVERGLSALDKRQGYRGPIEQLSTEKIEAFLKRLQDKRNKTPIKEGETIKGVVTEVNDSSNTVTVRMGDAKGLIGIDDMRWARRPNSDVSYRASRVERPGDVLSAGDVVLVKIKGSIEDEHASSLWRLALEQTPMVQAALLCIESETGHVKAMVGGRDFRKSQFNRAVQSRRQPGSAFKPIIYAAALDRGYTPATIIIDSPVVFRDVNSGSTWKPRNFGEKFHGPTTFRDALAKSRNVVTVKILRDIGIDYAMDYAARIGIESRLSRDLSIALGTSGVSLLELVNTYSVFNNLGYLVQPVFITKIVDRDGNVIEENRPKGKKVIEESTAYVMTSLLKGVVTDGTGRRVRALNRPVAGKTGTTDNLNDAWFIGYTPRYTAGVWVGFDDGGTSLGKGETGSRAASPIWLDFMKNLLADKPIRTFQVPEEVVFAKIDAKTGLLPTPESEKTIFESFKKGTAPTEYTKRPDSTAEPERFFKSGM